MIPDQEYLENLQKSISDFCETSNTVHKISVQYYKYTDVELRNNQYVHLGNMLLNSSISYSISVKKSGGPIHYFYNFQARQNVPAIQEPFISDVSLSGLFDFLVLKFVGKSENYEVKQTLIYDYGLVEGFGTL